MRVLHLLRDPADPKAAAVIGAEAAQGVDLAVLLLRPGAPPPISAPVYVLDGSAPEGATAVDWDGALDLMFQAHTLVTW